MEGPCGNHDRNVATWQRHINSNPTHVPVMSPELTEKTGYGLQFEADDPALYLTIPGAALNFASIDPLIITWSCQNGGCRVRTISRVLKDGRKLKISYRHETSMYNRPQGLLIFEENQEVPDVCVEVDSFVVSFNVSLYTQSVLDQSLQQDVIGCKSKNQQNGDQKRPHSKSTASNLH